VCPSILITEPDPRDSTGCKGRNNLIASWQALGVTGLVWKGQWERTSPSVETQLIGRDPASALYFACSPADAFIYVFIYMFGKMR